MQRAAALVAPRDVWGLPPHADLDPREEIPDYIYSEEEPSRKLNTMAPGHDLAQAMTVSAQLLRGMWVSLFSSAETRFVFTTALPTKDP